MAGSPTLQALLDFAAGKVNEQKLRAMTQRLQVALGKQFRNQPVDDPIVIRRKLVAQMKQDGASAGTIEAFAQFFMGIVRRAAVEGLLPAPPEGPWTRAWQAVLGSSPGNRSQIRVLAAWATEQDLEPSDIDARTWQAWSERAGLDGGDASRLWEQIRRWADKPPDAVLSTASVLTARLKLKANGGSVRARK